jgi:hypothetical protein
MQAMKTADYLIALRGKLGQNGVPATDYRVAKALKIRTQLMSKYSNGQNIPGPVVGFRIAEILGDQPAAVIADLEAERAERDGNADDADYLRNVVKKLAGGAMSVLLACGLGGMSNADARLARTSPELTPYTSYELKPAQHKPPVDCCAERVPECADLLQRCPPPPPGRYKYGRRTAGPCSFPEYA